MKLKLRGAELDLARPQRGAQPGRWPGEHRSPFLMGILNAGPDSFSDPGKRGPRELAARGRELAADGATLIDVGGESGRTDTEPVPEAVEIERIVPVVQELAGAGLLVSVDTWRAPVAREALAAGAALINDVSALSDPGVAKACAMARAGLVITHTRAAPKTKDFPTYADVMSDVVELLRERMAAAIELGVDPEAIVLDPGIDLAKTPDQSIEVMRRLPELAPLGRPLLLAVSRKDFVGALTGRAPAARDAGTLAAVGAAVAGGAHIVRVHDVRGARDYLRVRAALEGGTAPAGALAEDLRRESA